MQDTTPAVLDAVLRLLSVHDKVSLVSTFSCDCAYDGILLQFVEHCTRSACPDKRCLGSAWRTGLWAACGNLLQFYHCCVSGDLSQARVIAAVWERPRCMNRALLLACEYGQTSVVEWLLNQTEALNYFKCVHAFELSCRKGFVETARAMYDFFDAAQTPMATAFTDQCRRSAATLFFLCLEDGHLTMVQWLYDLVGPAALDGQEKKVLQLFVAACKAGVLDLAQWLWRTFACVQRARAAVLAAFYEPDFVLVARPGLQRRQVSPFHKSVAENVCGPWLQSAFGLSDHEIVQKMGTYLEHAASNTKAADVLAWQLGLLARPHTLRVFLNACSVAPNLQWLCTHTNAEADCVRDYIEATNDAQFRIMKAVCCRGQLDMVTHFHSLFGLPVWPLNRWQTLLCDVAARGHHAVLQWIVDTLSPPLQDIIRLLREAVGSGSVACVQKVLGLKLDMIPVDVMLSHAIFQGHTQLVQWLCENFPVSNVDVKEITVASNFGCPDLGQYLLNKFKAQFMLEDPGVLADIFWQVCSNRHLGLTQQLYATLPEATVRQLQRAWQTSNAWHFCRAAQLDTTQWLCTTLGFPARSATNKAMFSHCLKRPELLHVAQWFLDTGLVSELPGWYIHQHASDN